MEKIKQYFEKKKKNKNATSICFDIEFELHNEIKRSFIRQALSFYDFHLDLEDFFICFMKINSMILETQLQ